MSLNSMSLEEIENFGKSIQKDISDGITQLMSGMRNIDLGNTGKEITELSMNSTRITKGLESKGILKLFDKPKKWLAKYDTIEGSIQRIDDSINTELERLHGVLNGLHLNANLLKDKLVDLEKSESEISAMIADYDGSDDLKYQAAIHRQKLLVTTTALVKQEIAKSVIILAENQEVTHQLEEAKDNLIPYIKIMLMNTLASKANTEGIKLKESMKKAANNMVIATAREIENNADELIKSRTDTIIEFKTLEEAQSVLTRTCKKIADSTVSGTEENIRLIKSLKESMLYLEDLQVGSLPSIEGGKK